MRYICRIWAHNKDSYCLLSRGNEELKDFKVRVSNIYPDFEGWHYQYSEFKEIF
jgi:hypothetical protein